MVFPAREFLLEPFFEEKNLGMIYAPRGLGKTIVGIGIALAISAGGSFLRWRAPRARRVLYFDGELPQETLQKRIRDVARASGLAVTRSLRLITPDLQPAGVRIPNLADVRGQ
jgi:putative DNA primase/helicase